MDRIKMLGLLLLCQCGLSAQTTGNFEATLQFGGETRVLSGYVPTDYDSTLQYQVLIGLHGLGDLSNNYRNVLVNSDWMDLFPQTILICPDGGNDAASNFNVPEGDEAIIDEVIAYANANYTIDTNAVFLQGFSLGGRAALKYGLNHPDKFKGLLLNAPAVQGVNDVHNTLTDSLNIAFEYSNASQIPIFIVVGEEDILYEYTLQAMYPILKKHNAIVNNVVIPGMAHTIPSNDIMAQGLAFIEQNSNPAYDVDLFEITNAERICENAITPEFYIRNTGDSSILSLEFTYELDGMDYVHTWNGNLEPYAHSLIDLPTTNLTDGSHDLSIEIAHINGVHTDTILHNNSLELDFQSGISTETIPFAADFEEDMDAWIMEQSFNIFEWVYSDEVANSGQYSLHNFNCPLIFDTKDRVESIESPLIDFSSSNETHRVLAFDIAYNYLKYTPPYMESTTYFADTLEILVSSDCGEHYETVFRKGGYSLKTSPEPLLNKVSVTSCIFIPTAEEWDTLEIDLSQYADESEVKIKFNYISALGGTIYIDNLRIGTEPLALEEELATSFKIYPNPTSDLIQFEGISDHNNTIRIFDMQGKIVLQQEHVDANTKVDLSQLSVGVYQVEMNNGKDRKTEKLIISK